MSGAKESPALALIRYTRNFESNLKSIESFWIESGFAPGFDRLLDGLEDSVLPILQRHPRIGRPFARREARSAEAQAAIARIQGRVSRIGVHAEVREYVMDDYVVLYVVADDVGSVRTMVQLLAIKHHKQLGDMSAV
ncbi:type II toxin-antitoxin system RelE/ParE family toxin [Variovorax sp. KK3]|uniref:type II toxin-antitoxin system RelE/ParE family toxin n=1 Tax=Variovorax sp. KK3 TaxID=1855728 RepID=UPI00097BEBC4|nr:type II toxin-antitoxin system RelE/ParE family toxin [Variovorax sp. KK3]